MTLLPSQRHSHHEALEGTTDRGPGPALGGSAFAGEPLRRPAPSAPVPGAAASRCLRLLGSLIPWYCPPGSQALHTSTPLWPSLAPCQWACHPKCPQGSVLGGAARDFHASWHLPENCLQVPPMDKAPPI